MQQAKEGWLGDHDFLADIPHTKQFKTKMFQIAEKIVPFHSVIFHQDDPGDRYLIILSGKVKVLRKREPKQETDLSSLGTDNIFGEMPLLWDKERSESAKTLEETRFLEISRKHFDKRLRNDSSLSSALTKKMTSSLPRNDSIFGSEYGHRSKATKFSWLDCLTIIVIGILCGVIFNFSASNGIDLVPKFSSDEMVPEVAPQIALTEHWERSLFVDARPNIFYEQEHIKGAINMPSAIFDIMYMMELGNLDKNRHIIVYGRTVSSLYDKQVAGKLVLRGHHNTVILKGGLPAWKKKGYPVKS